MSFIYCHSLSFFGIQFKGKERKWTREQKLPCWVTDSFYTSLSVTVKREKVYKWANSKSCFLKHKRCDVPLICTNLRFIISLNFRCFYLYYCILYHTVYWWWKLFPFHKLHWYISRWKQVTVFMSKSLTFRNETSGCGDERGIGCLSPNLCILVSFPSVSAPPFNWFVQNRWDSLNHSSTDLFIRS